MEGTPIEVYNNGEMERDFTYIDDIVAGIYSVMLLNPIDTNGENLQSRIYNIGNHLPVNLGYFIETLESIIGKKAVKNYLPMQQGDVLKTYADISALTKATGFIPSTNIETGLRAFVDWYKVWQQKTAQ